MTDAVTEAGISVHNAIREALGLGLEDVTIPLRHAVTLRDRLRRDDLADTVRALRDEQEEKLSNVPVGTVEAQTRTGMLLAYTKVLSIIEGAA